MHAQSSTLHEILLFSDWLPVWRSSIELALYANTSAAHKADTAGPKLSMPVTCFLKANR